MVLPKKLEKQLRRRTSSMRRSVNRASGAVAAQKRLSAAAAMGVVAAGAGIAAALVRYWRGSRVAAKLHVMADGDRGWTVREEGSAQPIGTYGNKREAVSAARTVAAESAPSRLVIHRSDGSVSRSHRYERT